MIEGSILIDNLITNQTELLMISYDPTSNSEISKGTSTSKQQTLGFFDYVIVTLVVILITLIWLYNKNENGKRNVTGKNIDVIRFGGRKFEDPVKRMDNVFSANELRGNLTPDLLKTPLDKRKNLRKY